ncbi:MAG: hypothetical protein GX442_09590 [Candidatus Riflebacteria bacterium]|nr:hypothetical protein [Candidatus Riflebacteria bacterium]
MVTIIAILAGAALPYALQYIEDSRISRAKQDLDEIRHALVRWEIDHPSLYSRTDLNDLVGPYLSKAMADPWGSPYVVDSPRSICFSKGTDRIEYSPDDISMDFRPPLALAKVYFEDTNKNLLVETGDRLLLKFTRPLRTNPGDGPSLSAATGDFIYSSGNPANDYSAPAFSDNDRAVRLTLDFGANPAFRLGFDTISISSVNTIVDVGGTSCKSDQATVIQAAQ